MGEAQEPGRDAQDEAEFVAAVTGHVERHLGPVGMVLGDVAATTGAVDLLCVPPTEKRPWTSVVTAGMSRLPMEGAGDAPPHVELHLALPGDWPLQMEAFHDERHDWPIRLLKVLASFPLQTGTWLGAGHTLPNDDPPVRYARGTSMCGALLWPGALVPESFDLADLAGGRRTSFLAVFPLHADELTFTRQEGGAALMERFQAHRVTELLDPGRPSALSGEGAKTRKGLFRG